MEQKGKAYWHGVKRHRKICRIKRVQNSERHLPQITALCLSNQVEMSQVQHGFQFRLREYILNWAPTTNKVKIQYSLPGNDKTLPFTRSGQPNKPRIIVALEEMIQLVRSERSKRDIPGLSAS